MQFGRALALLFPALAIAANPGGPCNKLGAWDCWGDARVQTGIAQCSYNTPGKQILTWKVVGSPCGAEAPCCDHRPIEMGGVPHCNVRPTRGDGQRYCGVN